MMSRDKHEASIRRLDTYSGREWERALLTVLMRHPGLSFYTDEQIEEIRAQMVKDAWFSHQLARENRRRASLRSDGGAPCPDGFTAPDNVYSEPDEMIDAYQYEWDKRRRIAR